MPDAATNAAKLDHGATLRRQIDRRRFVRLDKINAAVDAIGQLPAESEVIHAVMSGTYDGFCIVPAVLDLAKPEMIQRLTIATLGFNRSNADELFDLLDRAWIGRCMLIASTYFRSVDAGLFGYIDAGLTSRGQRCAIVRSHAKLLLFEMSDGRTFVWESSANLRSCRNAETFVLSQSRELLDFHKQWIEELIAKTEHTE